jgi:hypothetical protein
MGFGDWPRGISAPILLTRSITFVCLGPLFVTWTGVHPSRLAVRASGYVLRTTVTAVLGAVELIRYNDPAFATKFASLGRNNSGNGRLRPICFCKPRSPRIAYATIY